METEYTSRIDSAFAGVGTPQWQEQAKKNPDAAEFTEDAVKRVRLMIAPASRLLPAFLALESILALAAAWSLFHRVSRARLGPPLGRLRDFRFSDQLVWGLILGIIATLFPSLAGLRTVGYNLLVFFGAVYALRGLGVLTWFLSPGRLGTAMLIGIGVMAWPLLGAFALGLGLGDTWIDWRSRARPTS